MTEVVARTLTDDEVTLDAHTVGTLRESLRGSLLLEGDPGYDTSRSIWNGMIDRRPALIARCLGVGDVVACVRWARERDLSLSAKGGGHNVAGLAVPDGGLMLDMSRMRGVWVDPASRTARVQAGCLLGDVDRETQIHGLATVLGFVSDTGVAGLTLGGGFGYLTRAHGWACDNLVSVDVVTADGRALRASEGEYRDLFWGLRGGGGNLGIATSLEYRLHPVGPQVVAGAIAWPMEHASEVLAMYADLTARAPRELTCLALLLTAPPVPWLSQEVHGAPVVMLVVCYTGTVEEGERHVAAIKAFGEPAGDIIGPRPYASQQRLFDASQPPGRRYYLKSEYLRDVPPDLLGRLVDHAQRRPSPFSTTFLFHLAGAIGGLPGSYSAMGNRDAAHVLMLMGSWENPAADEANIQWAREAWEDTRQYSTGGTYVNFLSQDEGAERVRAAYSESYERLAALKATWDPDNLFRMNKNVPPRAAR